MTAHKLWTQHGRRACTLLFWCALGVAVTMALLPKPPHLAIDSLGDKFEHSLAFVVLAALGASAYPRMPLVRLGERLSFLGASSKWPSRSLLSTATATSWIG
jgi:hypothetical protein